jgi:filamentous hemagglutinin
VKIGGTRIDLDKICGIDNKNCKTDASGNLELDSLSRVQWDETKVHMSMEEYMNNKAYEMGGATGGVQGLQGTLGTTPLIYNYSPGELTDWVIENYAGIHDIIGGQLPGYYDIQGNTIRGMAGTDRTIQNIWASIAVPLVTPFALSGITSYETIKLIEGLR